MWKGYIIVLLLSGPQTMITSDVYPTSDACMTAVSKQINMLRNFQPYVPILRGCQWMGQGQPERDS